MEPIDRLGVRLDQLEDRLDRRLARFEARLDALRGRVDSFAQASLPPVRGVFYDGQVFDAVAFALRHIFSAKESILLIDGWVDLTTLELLARKGKGVAVTLVTSKCGNGLAPGDIQRFNEQYGGLTVCESKSFHDRFLVVDDRRLYLIGTSLKDLGRKCFAFTALDPAEIPNLKARI